MMGAIVLILDHRGQSFLGVLDVCLVKAAVRRRWKREREMYVCEREKD
jgi:hypothetical protein